ncbi:hypothetical protein [Vulcanisaeta souniana]|uniref:Uncharacterized protein n=1 Tax=Vulcanisaeta souniana JCM 11219 TaxID=1293586 RepID=A0A830E0F9_9CREN|nr:hypothetical protein [Vulcanisaeta souniana]BDR91794.1 hypothetical protein Vsou_08870 [Vulcanisaeta souniana JCM 11219]GGI70327.1 hypothetical protein GCM10007112_04120 [Vulcanisaeta souniana JCM 11219]
MFGEEVKVIKQVKALGSDIVRPRCRVTYVLASSEERVVRVRYASSDEAGKR